MKLQSPRIKLACLLGLLVFSATALTVNAQPPAQAHVHVGVRPPPMRVEHVAPRAGHVWAPGYWGWNGGAHVWYGGHWEAERPGFRYIGASWVFLGGAWVLNPGFWQPIGPVVVVPGPVVIQAAPIVEQQEPTEYVQQQQQVAPPPGMDPNYWYYCQNPAGYYPYVQNCAAWQQVSPTPQ